MVQGIGRAAGEAVLIVVLLHFSDYSTCEAGPLRRPAIGTRRIASQSNDESGGGSTMATLASTEPTLAAGVTYRPPITNMNYFGGPVMWKPIHLYFVWYGTWSEAEKKLMRTVAKSLTPKKRIRQYPNLSNMWKVVTKYYQEPQSPGERRKYASDKVTIAGEVDDASYSAGHSIDPNSDPSRIILSHVGQGLPSDLEQGIYFLFTSADVKFSSPAFFCGYHDNRCADPSREGTPFCEEIRNTIIYSFVPIPSVDNELYSVCNVFQTSSTSGGLPGPPPNKLVSPNGALDTMINIFLHELLETAVDPIWSLKPAWIFDLAENSETADMCAYTYVAGDWFYCGLQSAYPDFPGVNDTRCHSYSEMYPALTEPKSHTTFNVYGIDGSKFITQLTWSLENKGCVSQPEESCPRKTVVLRKNKGTIQRGLFFGGVGLQRYAPGQNCSWKINVPNAKRLTLTFEKVALGYDDLDYVTVAQNNAIKKKVTGFGKNITVQVTGCEATIQFVTYGGRSPYPSSAGFIMHYKADF